MSLIRNFLKKENFAAFLLLVPTMLRWAPFMPIDLTIKIGDFLFFWPSVFYVVYIMMTHRIAETPNLRIIRNIIKIAFIVNSFTLLFVDNGNHAFSLWIQDLVFFSILYAFAFHTPTKNQLIFLKWPIAALFFYILIQMYAAVLGFYTFDDADVVQEGMMFIRAGTKAGESNSTSDVLYVFASILTGFYVKSNKIRILILGVTLVVIAMGATRGALLAITSLFVVLLIINMKGLSFMQKIVPVLFTVLLVIIVIQYNIFADVLFRQQDLAESGDITSGRVELMQNLINNSLVDSPIFGVGQGRAYPATKELARNITNNRKYSKYLGAPHNLWVLTLCEYGVVGLIGMLLCFYILFKNLRLTDLSAWSVIFVFLILFNTEAVIIHDQIFIFICFLILMSIYNNPSNKLLVK